jgi:hypothetical protein
MVSRTHPASHEGSSGGLRVLFSTLRPAYCRSPRRAFRWVSTSCASAAAAEAAAVAVAAEAAAAAAARSLTRGAAVSTAAPCKGGDFAGTAAAGGAAIREGRPGQAEEEVAAGEAAKDAAAAPLRGRLVFAATGAGISTAD